MIREIDWYSLKQEFSEGEPFHHVVVDNFFLPEVADKISEEFPDFNAPFINNHNNPLEIKKTLNHWDKFPPATYRAFALFGKNNFVENIRNMVEKWDLEFDFGLNGGGWHMHGRGGNNNIHLDYNVHPKLHMQRKINIIVYMTKGWEKDWGGGLEFWSHDDVNNQPLKLIKTIENKYNRAVIFDTTQNSWHGLPNAINCPEGVIRKSIAAYYVCAAPSITEERGRALFAPREDQKNDESVKEIIRKRASVTESHTVYNTK